MSFVAVAYDAWFDSPPGLEDDIANIGFWVDGIKHAIDLSLGQLTLAVVYPCSIVEAWRSFHVTHGLTGVLSVRVDMGILRVVTVDAPPGHLETGLFLLRSP